MKKLAIIGASYLQEPLIQKAKNMGLETHVFAWPANDIGEKSADYFYPISITKKETILQKCREMKVNGICSIASDLASITVNYVAAKMGLIGNSVESAYLSTNKYAMRQCFYKNNDPSPKSFLVKSPADLIDKDFQYPVIVKPVDRSGSRGITKLTSPAGIGVAIEFAKKESFIQTTLIEEFVEGTEYSAECISYNGIHNFLALTLKYTTGAPHFIETGHLEPAPVSDMLLEQIKAVTFHALDSLQIKNGASHTEFKITPEGKIMLIEIGGRMGGDCIGSHLVQISTGIDFVKAVIQVSLGQTPDLSSKTCGEGAAIRFIFSEKDIAVLSKLKAKHLEYIVSEHIENKKCGEIVDSSTRQGYFLFKAPTISELVQFLP